MTIQFLQGTAEPFPETIRRLLASEWDDSETMDVTPVMVSPNGQGDAEADHSATLKKNDWKILDNRDAVRIYEGDTARQDPADMWNRTQRMVTTVYIDIFATSPLMGTLMKNEINRIILGNMPNNSDRILKSNGTENSAIATWDRQSIDWEKINDVSDRDTALQYSGQLGCVWSQTKD